MRYCEAQLCSDCLNNQGQILGDRALNPRARYCAACSLLIRRRQSARWKQLRRSAIGWRAYQQEYSPYADQEEKRIYHRHYIRRWRAARKASLHQKSDD